jgi:hypothetical protein
MVFTTSDSWVRTLGNFSGLERNRVPNRDIQQDINAAEKDGEQAAAVRGDRRFAKHKGLPA